MEDPFLLHIAHTSDQFSRKIRELDEKLFFFTEEVLTKKQNEMQSFLSLLVQDLPPKPDDSISFRLLRSERSKEQSMSNLPIVTVNQSSPRRMNSEKEISQSTIINKPPELFEKNPRNSDIYGLTPMRPTSHTVRSVSQSRGGVDSGNTRIYQSTFEKTTIIRRE